MPTCPNGHQSGSDDWCEVCGHRMAGSVPPPPPPPPPGGGYGFPPPQGGRPGQDPELCPQCRTPREGGAPFCEECRWNFLTNTATSYTPAAPRPQGPGQGAPRFQQPPGPSYGGADPFEYQGSRPSQVNRPAEPIPPFGGDPSRPDPSGPPNFGGQGQSPFGHQGRPDQQGPPPYGTQPGRPDQGRPPFGSDPDQQGPPHFGGRPDQQNPPFGGQGRPDPSGPPAPPNFGGPSGYGSDPSRPVPPPPGPTPSAGPGGPQAFQQAGPPAPPAFPQRETGRPQQGGQGFGGGDDDWVISPPTHGPGGQGGPGGRGPQGGQGGYGYPGPGAQQAPGYPQAPRGPVTWTATIGPDREYFMAMMQRSGPEATGLNLPAYSPEQQRTLSGNQVTIGRRRHSTGDTPDIDLAVPPEDPGVSHQHAVLVQQADGNWAVVDQNSTNGTTVNGGEEPIQPFVPVPLQDGDRVHVGAWTTITVRRG
ncbi:FHA domain-containing protein [Streptomyces sp. ACT015]|uniref:FHA domain-containing protein n=1 Tax=Streptomyces sp. ACT015 TaxID=3134807 RepID=UPI003D1819D7